jgi:RNA polymerase sigma-70 factor (ECF subfamily)
MSEPQGSSTPEPASVDLLAKAIGGDRVAMQSLMQRHLPGLRAYIRLRMGPRIRAREESTDLVQSVCREVLQHADRFEHGGETGFRHWLYRTAMRKISDRDDYHGAARRNVARETELASESNASGFHATLSTPSRVAIAREQLARLETAVDGLSDVEREVVLGARIMGLSHAELAARVGRSESAVRTLLCRAMARLSQILASEEADGRRARQPPAAESFP